VVFYDFTDNDRDTWPAGYAGLFVGPQSSAAATEFDDVTMWIDNDSDGTIDEQQFADDFSSNEVTLTYDDNGNLTYDGVFTYVYDAQNRVVEAQRVSGGDTTTVASYAYYPDNRRAEKIVQNSGPEIVENDGGNTTVRFYYAGIDPATSRWNIVETRNGSNQATFQYVWGTQYVDELVLIDKNLEVTVDSDSDPDVTSTAETNDGDSPDSRFLVHQDRNWNVVALTDYDPDSTVEGAVVERYSYTPYGEVTVLNGVGTTSREFGNVRVTSSVGNVFHHQGLPLDHDKQSYQNRWREYRAHLARFERPDPIGFRGTANRFLYVSAHPHCNTDPRGLTEGICPICSDCQAICDPDRPGGSVFGELSCEGGQLCCCICDENIKNTVTFHPLVNNPDAERIVAACVLAHETWHVTLQPSATANTEKW
jgi:RHS repeat-associated protein